MKPIDKFLDSLPNWVYYTVGVIVTVIVFIIGVWAFIWMFHFVSKVLPTP